jgi:hypothetical protein
MDPNEIVKHIPEIARATTAVAASVPFTSIVKRMLGPAADEVAEMWRDQVRLYRYERQLKCVEKAERMAREAGFTPQAVPPKILFPLLEGASFEDNEDLHTMWSALLANAASPDAEKVRPGFIAILRHLSADEARMLNRFYEAHHSSVLSSLDDALHWDRLSEIYRDDWGNDKHEVRVAPDPRLPEMDLRTCLDGLEAYQLIRQRTIVPWELYSMTARGYQFVAACRPPKVKSNS